MKTLTFAVLVFGMMMGFFVEPTEAVERMHVPALKICSGPGK